MSVRHGELAAHLDAGPDSDAEAAAELTQRLRDELLALDVETVRLASGGDAPAGAKGAGLLSVGGLVVRFALQTEVLKSIVTGVSGWLQRQRARSVKLTIDGDTLELNGVSSADQKRLIDMWVARHAVDG